MKRFITAWVILSAVITCNGADKSLHKDGIGSRGGAVFAAAAVKVNTNDNVYSAPKPSMQQKLTDKAWSQAQSQGSRLEAEAMRIAQKSSQDAKNKNTKVDEQKKKELQQQKQTQEHQRKLQQQQQKALQKELQQKQQAQQKAQQKQQKAQQKAKSKQQKKAPKPSKPVNFERSVTSFQPLRSNQVYPAAVKRAPAPVAQVIPPAPRRRRAVSSGKKYDMPFREGLVDSALWFVLTMASLTSVSNIMAVVIDHYENAIYGEESLSLGMMVTKQRILGGIMELFSVLLMTNPEVRQLGAFFITLMYTGSLISGDLAVWEAVITGAVAAMALVVFADETMYAKDLAQERKYK